MQGVSEQISNPVWLIYLIVLLPLISALGAHFNYHDALLLVYLLVGVTVFFARLRLRTTFADIFFLVAIGAAALSLFLSVTLSSPYIFGDDAHVEWSLFQQVAQAGAWQPEVSGTYNSALSITILPTIISSVSSLDGILVFKIVYPFLFSIVPMLLYRIYRKIMPPEAAYISVFVFLFFPSSYVELMQLNRQMIAELILVVLLWVELSPTLRKASRLSSLLVLLLTLGLVMSHYSLALIYVFLITFCYVCSRISRLRIEPLGDINLLLISLVVSLGWFLSVAGGAVLQTLSVNFSFISADLSSFFNASSRPSVVADAVGLTGVNTGIWHLMNRGTQYLVLFCIVLGFLIYVRKRRTRAEGVLMPLMAASLVFLLASVAVPFLAGTLRLERIYHIALLSISPCFYLGAVKITDGLQWLVTFLSRHPIRVRIGSSMAAAILFSYLLFTSGWVWSVTWDVPTSPVLDKQRMPTSSDLYVALGYYSWYTLSEDVAAARWIRAHGTAGRLVCSDSRSELHILTSYGDPERIGPTIPDCDYANQYVYLSLSNSRLGVGMRPTGGELASRLYVFSFNDTTPTLFGENKIYSDEAAIMKMS